MRQHVVADAHNDLLFEVAFAAGENPFSRTWLGNLDAGNVRLQVCAVASDMEHVPDAALRNALLLTQAFHGAVRENRARVSWVRWCEDLDTLDTDANRIGLLLSLEGAEPLCREPKLADVFFALGFRLFGLTWSVRNPFADGQNEASDGGLSNVGRELVDRIAALGGVLDLAHASLRTFDQILERNESSRVFVSHAGCRAVYDIPRNVSDEQLRALRERDGVFGIACLPLMVDEADWSMSRLIDHVDHAVSVVGVERVCIGADFVRQIWRAGMISRRSEATAGLAPGMTGDSIIEGLGGPEDFGKLTRGLYERGYDEASVDAIMSGNLLRFLRDALPSEEVAGA